MTRVRDRQRTKDRADLVGEALAVVLVLTSILAGPVAMIVVIVFAVPLLALTWEVAWRRWVGKPD